jgi:hypothetical protein
MIGQSRKLLVLLQVLAAVAASSLVITFRLSHEGELAEAASDLAFSNGELRTSLIEAQTASIMSISNLPRLRRSVDRLGAIALGSEATGRPKTALLAWSSLSATGYCANNVLANNPMLGQQAEQHLTYLLDKVAGAPATSDVRHELPAGSSLRLSTYPAGIAAILIVAGLLATITGFLIRSSVRRSRGDKTNPQLALICGIYFIAFFSWSIGWIIA